MLYKVVLIFKSVDKTLVCDHSNESYWAVLSYGTVYYAVQGDSNLGLWLKLLGSIRTNYTNLSVFHVNVN